MIHSWNCKNVILIFRWNLLHIFLTHLPPVFSLCLHNPSCDNPSLRIRVILEIRIIYGSRCLSRFWVTPNLLWKIHDWISELCLAWGGPSCNKVRRAWSGTAAVDPNSWKGIRKCFKPPSLDSQPMNLSFNYMLNWCLSSDKYFCKLKLLEVLSALCTLKSGLAKPRQNHHILEFQNLFLPLR